MSFIEIKVIKAVAALHRGVVNTAIRTLSARETSAYKRHEKKIKYARDLDRLADRTREAADNARINAANNLNDSIYALRSAFHTVENLRDDLDKIS